MKVDMKLSPYRPVKVQFLSEADRGVRVGACRCILQKYDNELRRDKLLFSDECSVHAEGHSRSKQIFFWSKQNPFFSDQIRQHPLQVMIFAAMSSKHLIGPFFLEGGVTAEAYINMLRNELLPELERGGISGSAHFQQDGHRHTLSSLLATFYTSTLQIGGLVNMDPRIGLLVPQI